MRKDEINHLSTKTASQEHRIDSSNSWHLNTHGVQIFENKGLVNSFEPNRLDFYVVALNRNGSAVKEIGLLSYNIQPLTIHFLAPGIVHTLTALSSDIDGFYICFTSDFYAQFCIDQNSLSKLPFYQHEGVPLFQLPIKIFDVLESLFQRIHDEQQSRQFNSSELIWTLLHQIHLVTTQYYRKCAIGQAENSITSNPLALVQRFKKLVDKHFVEKRQIIDYANELLVSPQYLSGIIKDQTGYSPIFWLHRRIFLEAKYYLTHTDRSAKEIAQLLDFSSSAHFSKFFKKQSKGQTLTQFKQQLKNR